MDKTIVEFIKSNQVLTLATSFNNKPYCALCFYVFDEELNQLIFLASDKTRHINECLGNILVAGSINNCVTEVEKIQGIQFEGEFIAPNQLNTINLYKKYYKKFPIAAAMPSPIWAIDLTYIKMTDNTLGFGKKVIWNK